MKQCIKCNIIKDLVEYRKRNEKEINTCKICERAYRRHYDTKNRDSNSLKEKEYRDKNKDKYIERRASQAYRDTRNKLLNRRYKFDPIYKASVNIRNRIKNGIKNITATKCNNKTQDLLCCNFIFAKNHIEKQFKEGMSWENHGEVWHIDHIIPISFFDLGDLTERKLAFHYGNLRPLLACDNLVKSKRIPNHNFIY